VITSTSAAEFVRANTRLAPAPHIPEVRLHLADEAFGLWERTERELGGTVAPPPFWAFAWAGGQALARYLLDHADLVRGRGVFDLAAGSGVGASAAARAGAASVVASDIDRYALAAIELNAEANGVPVGTLGDVLGDGALEGGTLEGDALEGAQVVLAGDVFYSRPMTERVLPFLQRARARGARVLVGDPGRAYLPRTLLTEVASYDVPVIRALEDADVKRATVWQLGAGEPASPGRHDRIR
jgi:predicted nicotinamide N-methyase